MFVTGILPRDASGPGSVGQFSRPNVVVKRLVVTLVNELVEVNVLKEYPR